jgi:HNH endonuclease
MSGRPLSWLRMWRRACHAAPALNQIRSGIWVYNGLFELIDYWIEQSGGRGVFKFKLQFAGTDHGRPALHATALEDDRFIPSWVKLEVWKCDRGQCIKCGTTSGLHFDHIIPYSKGGSSKDPANIQILCGRHNLEKRDNIE